MPENTSRQFFIRPPLYALLLLLSSCSSISSTGEVSDPLEPYNRAMFAFNEGVDEYVMKPVAEAYDEVMPDPVKTGVSNVFSNLDDVLVIVNDLLQFKFMQAIEDLSRFVYNTTFGLFGLIDVATPMGLPKHNEDFGQTLASWGFNEGAYIVLPFLGPSTLRDTTGLYVDSLYDPLYQIEDQGEQNAAIALKIIDTRYRLLSATRIAEEAALDKYTFIRDAYLQHRRNLVYDGKPPETTSKPKPPTVTDEDLELEQLLNETPATPEK